MGTDDTTENKPARMVPRYGPGPRCAGCHEPAHDGTCIPPGPGIELGAMVTSTEPGTGPVTVVLGSAVVARPWRELTEAEVAEALAANPSTPSNCVTICCSRCYRGLHAGPCPPPGPVKLPSVWEAPSAAARHAAECQWHADKTDEEWLRHLRERDKTKIEALTAENARLQRQVDELQTTGTRLVGENRALRASLESWQQWPGEEQNRRADVIAYCAITTEEVGTSPHLPSKSRLRLAVRNFAEETMECLTAACPTMAKSNLPALVQGHVEMIDPGRVDLVELAHECIDAIWTAEHILVICGIDSGPLWEAVRAANQAKDQPGGATLVNGKVQKPPGWVKADIAGELVKQGWRPER